MNESCCTRSYVERVLRIIRVSAAILGSTLYLLCFSGNAWSTGVVMVALCGQTHRELASGSSEPEGKTSKHNTMKARRLHRAALAGADGSDNGAVAGSENENSDGDDWWWCFLVFLPT